jgi:hypothetical protein
MPLLFSFLSAGLNYRGKMSQTLLNALWDRGNQKINNTLKYLRVVKIKESYLITYGFIKSGVIRRMVANFITSTVYWTLRSTKSGFLPAKLMTY